MAKRKKEPQRSSRASRNAAKAVPRSSDATRQLLLNAGKKLFARKGLDGTTVKQIADEAGVNISLVSYHFEGKEGLYRACLDQFGRERLTAARRLLTPPQSVEELRVRLSMFVGEMLGCHSVDSDIIQMLHRECESEMALTQDIFQETFFQMFTTLVDFFRAGQKAGFIRKDLDPKIAGASIIGTISHLGKMDFANRKYFNQTVCDPKYREKIVQQLTQLTLEGTVGAPAEQVATSSSTPAGTRV